MVPQFIAGCIKGSKLEKIGESSWLIRDPFSKYFGHSRDVDGCPGILLFIQKDSCEHLVMFVKVVNFM